MRKIVSKVVEESRYNTILHPVRSSKKDGNNGLFRINSTVGARRTLNVIASSGDDWEACGLPGKAFEHVSVSITGEYDKTPTWQEMDFVKRLFWEDNEVVVQFHVNDSRKVNINNTLHLWKVKDEEFILPPKETLG